MKNIFLKLENIYAFKCIITVLKKQKFTFLLDKYISFCQESKVSQKSKRSYMEPTRNDSNDVKNVYAFV
jgi:hypothetical protein